MIFQNKLKTLLKSKRLITLSVFTLIVISFFLGINYQKMSSPASYQYQNTPAVTEQTTTITADEKDETVNWKTFTTSGSEYFSFKYPSNWFIEESTVLDGAGFTNFFLEGTNPQPTTNNHTFGNEVFKILQYGDETVFNGLKRAVPSPMFITVDGNQALKGDNGIDILIGLEVKSVLHLETREESKPYIDQILSTFRFTDLSADYFEVKELGIKFKTTADIKDLIYEVKDNSAWFSTKSLAAYDQYCSFSQAAIGVYSKIYKSELVDDPNTHWTRTNKGLKEATINKDDYPAHAKEFSDFYIVYEGPQSTCSDNRSVQVLQTKQLNALLNSILTVEVTK